MALLLLDPIWSHFKATATKNIWRCKYCSSKIKACRERKSSLMTHIAMHKKKGKLVKLQEAKSMVIGTMVASLNYPSSTFEHPAWAVISSMTKWGPVDDSVAAKCAIREAK